MYSSYQKAIEKQLLLKPEEWNFKSNRDYKSILEHCDINTGKQYLNVIKDKFKFFYDFNIDNLKHICELNDKYGSTNKYQIDDFMNCSPSNLRYILHSLLILEDMKKYKLKNVDIIEIGGGYGGLCVFIIHIAPLYGITVNSYTIFDLLEASLLQKKYLNALNIEKINCCHLDKFDNLKNDSFLISNYAFSEISLELQKQYTEKVINPYTKYGFLAWNFISVYDFVENSIIEKEKEYPQTGRGSNYYVRYYPTSNL